MAGLCQASTNLAMPSKGWQGCAGYQHFNNLACQVDSSYYILTLLTDFILTCELTAGAHLNLILTELQELINHVKKAMATEGTALYSPEWAKLEKDKAWHG